jgi:hypothetical protein
MVMAFIRPVVDGHETILARCGKCSERVATYHTFKDRKTGELRTAEWRHIDRQQCEHDVRMPSAETTARHVARFYREGRDRTGPKSAVRCYV